MHIHLPKALENWRDVAREIAIIVVGVLIALFAEEAASRWERNDDIKAAEGAMRRELLWDNGPQIYQRAVMHPCVTARLDAIRAAVEAGKSRQEIAGLIGGFHLQFLTYDRTAHDAATSSDLANHMPQAVLEPYTLVYGVMPRMDRISLQEAADVARLRALKRTGDAPLSEAESSQVLGAVEALRNDDLIMWMSAKYTLPLIRRIGGELDPERVRRFMDDAREHYGACIKD
jgi:hypothetical protein